MDCLDNYIGLKNCSTAIPDSGIYVNVLPGINTELVDKIATSEQVNFLGVWENVKQRSFLRLKNDVVMRIQERMDFNDIIFQTKNLMFLTPSNPVVNSGAEYRGVYIKIPTTKYAEYYIDILQVYSDAIVTTDVKVFDINDGKELFSLTIDLVEGLNNITIDEYFPLRYGNLELFIGVDASGFNSVETYQESYNWYDDDFECVSQNSFHGQRNYSLVIQPAKMLLAADALYDNIDRSSSGFGISLVSQIKCSIDAFVCQNRKQLEQALLYLMGAEILMEKIGSPRLNAFTSTNLENTEYLRLEFEKRYTDNLKRSMKTIPLEGEGFCFNCSGGEEVKIEYAGSMP